MCVKLYFWALYFISLVYMSILMPFLVAQMALGQEYPLEKGMATHSNILAWRTPWTEEPGGLQSMGLQRVGHDHRD